MKLQKFWFWKLVDNYWKFENILIILVSIFNLSHDEREGTESVRLTWTDKGERETFDPNGIGL